MMKKTSWLNYEKEDQDQVRALADRYRSFISRCKTERECTAFFREEAEKAGFENLEDLIRAGRQLKEGDRVYAVGMNKTIALFIIGSQPLTDGWNMLCAHIDSPRLDLKQVPFYEDFELAFLDTHYYGGIKHYHWVALPLALHGVVAKKDGSLVNVCIGEDPEDPVVYITDLLIHLSGKQLEKKAREVIAGESLDILAGTIPAKEDCDDKTPTTERGDQEESCKDRVKANVLRILKEKYDIEEEDFLSAEIEAVPAGPARDCGLDRSMIAGYGHDDRSCAYPIFEAILETKTPRRTACCLFVDKEEIGSEGATGMHSRFFENTVAELLALAGLDSDLAVRRTMARSSMISSDVSAAFDPAYPDVFEKKNCAYLGKGLSINKYTGSRGKDYSNDANAEYLARIRSIFDQAGVAFQTAELGRVDAGGGGTIAYIAARFGMNVVDAGVPVLSMHAPCEVISKADLYEAKKGYIAFLNEGC